MITAAVTNAVPTAAAVMIVADMKKEQYLQKILLSFFCTVVQW